MDLILGQFVNGIQKLRTNYYVLCITPVKHLNEVYRLLKKNRGFIYKPYINKKNLKLLIKNNKNINAIFCNPNKQGYVLDKNILENTGIRIINTASTGTNHINLEHCKNLKIKVFSLKEDRKLINNLPSTSELSFALMISLLKKIVPSYNSVKNDKTWDYENFIGQELASLTIGIIGFGRLGKFMAKFCNSFGMRVLIYDKYKTSKKYQNVSLRYLAKYSNVVSIHVHLKKDTFHLINKNFLDYCTLKPIIINTSRGDIVDENAIIQYLKQKKILGYAADVISDELTNIKKSILIRNINKLNVLITPHIGGMTEQGQKKAYLWAASKFLKN